MKGFNCFSGYRYICAVEIDSNSFRIESRGQTLGLLAVGGASATIHAATTPATILLPLKYCKISAP